MFKTFSFFNFYFKYANILSWPTLSKFDTRQAGQHFFPTIHCFFFIDISYHVKKMTQACVKKKLVTDTGR